MKKILIILIVLLIPFLSWAACTKDGTTITCTDAADCTAANLQTQLDSASAGDTVYCSYEGTIDWTSRVIVSGGKTLKGPGLKTGDSSAATGSWPLTINANFTGSGATDGAIRIVNDDNQKVNRVTGFKFTASANATSFISTIGKGVGEDGKGAFRIDNNHAVIANASTISRIVYFNGHQGKLSGVIDHNVFGASAEYTYISYYNEQVGSSPDDRCYGYPSYARPIGFGTNDFFFIEDNYLTNLKVATSGGGGRIVVRYNTLTGAVNGSGFIDGHPMDTIGWHATGAAGGEIYKNTVTHSALSNTIDLRNGKWIVWDNTLTSGRIQLRLERVSLGSPLEWKACSGAHCCPTIYSGYCDVEHPTSDNYAACHPLPAQISDTYLWNNQTALSADVEIYRDTTTYIAPNVDYWIPTSGLKSAIPGTCTTGAGYWATDENALYKCTTTNTWTAYYTPYTYPHPLRGESDTTAPTATWAIDTTGLIATGTFSENVNATTKTGVSLTGSVTGAITATYKSGMPGGIVLYDLNKDVQQGETVVVDYTTPGDGIKDLAGNALADISDGKVSNGSTQSTPPLVALTIGAHVGATVNVYPGINCGSTCGPVGYDNGAVLTVSVTTLPNYTGCTIGGTGCGASTTMSEARTCTVTCTKISPDYTLGSGAVLTIGSGAAATIY